MQLNQKELQFIIASLDRTASSTLDEVVMKGSLLLKCATELRNQANPTVETNPAAIKSLA